MEKKIKLSIIIPVFNVEKYVQTCLDSVIEQSFRDFEVIVVDDGSTDGSPAICDAAAKQDGRIRVIHQQNGGLSAARNAGLDIARGEWIGFLDSDDFILPDMYEKLMDAAEKARADIAVCNYLRVDVQGKPIEKQDQPIPDAVLNRDDILRRALRAPFHVAWNKIYRRCIFETLRYPEGKLNEDMFTVTAIYDRAERIACLSDALYMYRVTPGSIMQTKKTFRHYDAVEAVDRCFQYYLSKGMKDMLPACEMRTFDSLRRVYYDLNQQERRAPETKAAKAIYRRELNEMRRQGCLSLKCLCRAAVFGISPELYRKTWNGK